MAMPMRKETENYFSPNTELPPPLPVNDEDETADTRLSEIVAEGKKARFKKYVEDPISKERGWTSKDSARIVAELQAAEKEKKEAKDTKNFKAEMALREKQAQIKKLKDTWEMDETIQKVKQGIEEDNKRFAKKEKSALEAIAAGKISDLDLQDREIVMIINKKREELRQALEDEQVLQKSQGFFARIKAKFTKGPAETQLKKFESALKSIDFDKTNEVERKAKEINTSSRLKTAKAGLGAGALVAGAAAVIGANTPENQTVEPPIVEPTPISDTMEPTKFQTIETEPVAPAANIAQIKKIKYKTANQKGQKVLQEVLKVNLKPQKDSVRYGTTFQKPSSELADAGTENAKGEIEDELSEKMPRPRNKAEVDKNVRIANLMAKQEKGDKYPQVKLGLASDKQSGFPPEVEKALAEMKADAKKLEAKPREATTASGIAADASAVAEANALIAEQRHKPDSGREKADKWVDKIKGDTLKARTEILEAAINQDQKRVAQYEAELKTAEKKAEELFKQIDAQFKKYQKETKSPLVRNAKWADLEKADSAFAQLVSEWREATKEVQKNTTDVKSGQALLNLHLKQLNNLEEPRFESN